MEALQQVGGCQWQAKGASLPSPRASLQGWPLLGLVLVLGLPDREGRGRVQGGRGQGGCSLARENGARGCRGCRGCRGQACCQVCCHCCQRGERFGVALAIPNGPAVMAIVIQAEGRKA